MYLKRIEATGFKSFADRTVIEFEKGITAIVGPNGSGKSNISDAVRWVLGEQSAKSLRGENMLDIIFNGTTSRRALNVAEVTVVLDNADKSIPIDYEEVSITRRVFRSGGGEYLINKQKVRLKDVRDLIMDIGIGSNSLSIISQDRIRRVVESRAEDRRYFIEEAAGVLKYKNRKKEAERKLSSTDENLVRVRDLLYELEGQVEPLRKEAEIAEKYLHKRKELENIEVALLASEISQLDQQIKEVTNEIKEINFEMVELNGSYTKNENTIKSLRNKYNENEQEISNLQQQITGLVREISLIEGRKQALMTKYPNEKDFEKLYNMRINEFEKNKQELKDMEQEIPVIKGRKNEAQKELNEHHMKLNTLVNEKNKLDSKIQVLNDFSGSYYQGVSAVIAARDKGLLSGIEGPLAELIEVDEDYVFAIDTALGAALQHIVTLTDNEARKAINHLKTNSLGRATFLPINVMKPRYVMEDKLAKIRNHPSFVDIASNLVRYNTKYKNVLENLLGQIIIASDLKGANELAKIINNHYRVVTLDGEVIHVGGSMTGGKTKRNRSSILRQKTDLEEAIERVKQIDIEIEKANGFVEELTTKISQINDRVYGRQLQIIRLTEWINHNQGEIELLREGSNNEQILSLNVKRSEIEEQINAVRTGNFDVRKQIQTLELELRDIYRQNKEKESDARVKEISKTRMDMRMRDCLSRLSDEYQTTYEAAQKNYKLEIEEDLAKVRVKNLRQQINAMGQVNIGAIEQYKRIFDRYNFLKEQQEDLIKAKNTIITTISELDEVMVKKFKETFDKVNIEFTKVFKQLFNGGHAELRLEDKHDLLTTGIEIIAQPPGTKLTNSNLLSGGQKSLTSISLLFAVLKVTTVPFSVLDEVEAALDESNVIRFADYLHYFSNETQFIVITHRKGTMEKADTLYGVTMQESGITNLVSVRFEDTDEFIDKEV